MLPHYNAEEQAFEGPIFSIGDGSAIAEFFASFGDGGSSMWANIGSIIGTLWNVYSVVAIFVSLLFFLGFVYAKIRYEHLSELEEGLLLDAERQWAEKYGQSTRENSRWQDVQDHVTSDVPSNWRLAIIEADILLEEALENAGYTGTTISERLKSVNPTSFGALQDAWNAHKVRNQIAHEGADFILTKKMANETIVQFERALRELGAL